MGKSMCLNDTGNTMGRVWLPQKVLWGEEEEGGGDFFSFFL